MRSRYADTFNHDADAPDYDADVANEMHPVRAGYRKLLEWVAQSAEITERDEVLELGSGTGNLTRLLLRARRIVAVDVSEAMLAIAATKLDRRIEWFRGDLLQYFDHCSDRFDRIVSTYAIHHLMAEEKALLFQRIRNAANPGARVVFGDLMFETAQHRNDARDGYRAAWPDVAEVIDEEFFWTLDDSIESLEGLGFSVATRRFSDLSWGVLATLD